LSYWQILTYTSVPYDSTPHAIYEEIMLRIDILVLGMVRLGAC